MINYKTCISLSKELERLCPKGVDVYIDNVGGNILDSVLLNIRKRARIVLCGAISSYNEKKAPNLRFYPLIISNMATVEGFIVWDFRNRFDLATKDLSRWVKKGKLKYREEIVEGLENAPRAL